MKSSTTSLLISLFMLWSTALEESFSLTESIIPRLLIFSGITGIMVQSLKRLMSKCLRLLRTKHGSYRTALPMTRMFSTSRKPLLSSSISTLLLRLTLLLRIFRLALLLPLLHSLIASSLCYLPRCRISLSCLSISSSFLRLLLLLLLPIMQISELVMLLRSLESRQSIS